MRGRARAECKGRGGLPPGRATHCAAWTAKRGGSPSTTSATKGDGPACRAGTLRRGTNPDGCGLGVAARNSCSFKTRGAALTPPISHPGLTMMALGLAGLR